MCRYFFSILWEDVGLVSEIVGVSNFWVSLVWSDFRAFVSFAESLVS